MVYQGANFLLFEQTVISWVQGIVGNVPIVSLYTNSVRPTQTFISYFLQQVEQKGIDYTPTDDTLNNVGNYEVTVGFCVYSQSVAQCYQIAQQIRQAAYLDADIQILQQNGVAFFRMTGMTDVSGKVGAADTIFERRVEFQLIFGIGNVYTNNIGQIQTVNGEGTYLNPDGSTAVQEPFSVVTP